MTLICLEEVRRNGNRPRVHGNGFIQIDLTERSRLHIWGDPRIPRQKVATPIHDHVFGFRSTIIVGRLFNIVYGVHRRVYKGAPTADYRVYQPEIRRGEDTVLMPTDEYVSILPVKAELIDWNTAARSYTMDAFDFHETFATEPSATVMQKDGPTQAQGANVKPSILVRVDLVPDNEFDRYAADEDLLWRIAEDVLRRRAA